MPVADRSGSQGQVLRGSCPTCGQKTKGRDHTGKWVSRCAHPGESYETKLVAGGKKTKPVIPDSVDKGQLGGGEEEGEAVRVAMHVVRSGEDDGEGDPSLLPHQASPEAPGSYPVRESLLAIAEHARGLSGALLAAQDRIRFLAARVGELQAELREYEEPGFDPDNVEF